MNVRGAAALLAAGLLLVGLPGCGDTGPERRSVEVLEVLLLTPDSVRLLVASCNGDPTVTELEETGTEVRVEVSAVVMNPGDACLDELDVALDEPLGERPVVDLTSGARLEPAALVPLDGP